MKTTATSSSRSSTALDRDHPAFRFDWDNNNNNNNNNNNIKNNKYDCHVTKARRQTPRHSYRIGRSIPVTMVIVVVVAVLVLIVQPFDERTTAFVQAQQNLLTPHSYSSSSSSANNDEPSFLLRAPSSSSSSLIQRGSSRTESNHIQSSSSSWHPSIATTATATFIPPVASGAAMGPIEDVTCNIEDLEHANDSQLHTILQELRSTAFFKHFVVDLDHVCPLASWRSRSGSSSSVSSSSTAFKKQEKQNWISAQPLSIDTASTATSDESATDNNDHQGEESQCMGGNVADELDEDAEPLCTVQGGHDGDLSNPDVWWMGTAPLSSTTPTRVDDDSDVGNDQMTNPNSQQSVSVPPLDSNALYSLQQGGFQSPSQEKTFRWQQHSNRIVVASSGTGGTGSTHPVAATTKATITSAASEADAATATVAPSLVTPPLADNKHRITRRSSGNSGTGFTTSRPAKDVPSEQENDDDEELQADAPASTPVDVASSSSSSCLPETYLPEQFWMDLCSNIGLGETTHVVNLQLNPERNTGYNGTHIWRAIYEENCIAVDHAAGMCLEERVLYRLLSGLHTSTTLSIAMYYYPPSKRKQRSTWEANPTYFYQKFQDHPEHVRNLHFAYVVLLRALSKASPYLYRYADADIHTGDIVQDETARILLKRLLDSRILQSCQPVFSAFDESLMFENAANSEDTEIVTLQKNFKGVFHNISSILDCVQCQQCKLHGKMSMLGYGTALKILFTPTLDVLQLERNEVVALINTVAKFSESMREVRELTHLYWMQQARAQADRATISMSTSTSIEESSSTTSTSTSPVVAALKADQDDRTAITESVPSASWNDAASVTVNDAGGAATWQASLHTVDAAVGLIAQLARHGKLTTDQETQLVQAALNRHANLLILVKHYGHDVAKFYELLQQTFLGIDQAVVRENASVAVTATEASTMPDAIVVGSGLAGLAATLQILDRGGRVVLIEKEHTLGGNSNKASSGINGCCLPDADVADSVELFRNDTMRSAGSAARPPLIDTLVQNSAEAIQWLKQRTGVDLSLKAQLGGHSAQRTHRPYNGMAGAEIILNLVRAIKPYVNKGQLAIYTDTRVTQLVTSRQGEVMGVQYAPVIAPTGQADSETLVPIEIKAHHVILATGGFASDRTDGSYLAQYRPELVHMSTTAGAFSTGDGITLATALGAVTTDMDKVQIHPTGWVDPTDPKNPSKALAAELLRGVGGILINPAGDRFCNELGTRAYVTDRMLSHNAHYAKTGTWDTLAPIPTFAMLLTESASQDARKHVDLYLHKGLMTQLEGVDALANWMNVSKSVLRTTLRDYQKAAITGKDAFGKTNFRNVPVSGRDWHKQTFYAGWVTPVLHYCMGGIVIDAAGHVLDQDGQHIPGLFAAGEVTGGVHGVNRLGGNSLLECTVYGSIVGKNLPIQQTIQIVPTDPSNLTGGGGAGASNADMELPAITMEELQRHASPGDCWVAIHGVVYDLTDFAEEHPAGSASIHALAGQDGTSAFAAVHNQGLLQDFVDDRKGRFDSIKTEQLASNDANMDAAAAGAVRVSDVPTKVHATDIPVSVPTTDPDRNNANSSIEKRPTLANAAATLSSAARSLL